MSAAIEAADLRDEAIALLADLHVSDEPYAAMATLDAWRARSPTHAAVLARAEQQWERMSTLVPEPVASTADTRFPRGKPIVRIAALAAAILLAVAMGTMWFVMRPVEAAYASVAGERRMIALSDGTSVMLDGATRLTTSLSRSRRNVELTAGRALFRVAHDADRPFEVHVRGVLLTDLGTVFSVDDRGDAVRVAVIDGRVAVSDGNSTQQLGPGQSARIGLGGITIGNATDYAQAVGWIDGRIPYRDVPLGTVLMDVNRLSRRPVAADAATSRLRFSGTLRSDGLRDWLHALPLIFPVRVESSAGGDRIVSIAASHRRHDAEERGKRN